MKFNYYDLGHKSRGEIIEVTLQGSAANVRLMDNSNYNNYKNGRQHRYTGGLVKQSPHRMVIPNSGRWYVTVDMNGLRGTVRSSVRTLPGALPTAREAPLSSVPSLVQPEVPPGLSDVSREFDVFLSHASDDKDTIVRSLANALIAEGMTVWYDEFEMRIGSSLRRSIDQGLAKSRIGLVVISKAFISKDWTNYEFDGIVTRAVTGDQILLPIWHGVTKSEVIEFSPSLADKLARNTATHTVEEIAEEIAELLGTHAA